MSAIVRLQEWYASQCDGDWEHSYGMKIETLDNPGWSLTIDLQDTQISHQKFAPVARGNPNADADWILCKLEGGQFVGAGGVHCLEELIEVFLTWAGV